MKVPDWLFTTMGFNFREVAEALCISTAALHHTQTGIRNLPSQAREALEHPLFQYSESGEDNLPTTWSDPDAEDRIRNWTIRRLLAAKRIEKLKTTLQKLEERNRQLQRIQHHGGEISPEAGDNRVAQVVTRWWILQKSKAAAELQKLTRARFEEIQLQLALAETEIRVLDSFLANP